MKNRRAAYNRARTGRIRMAERIVGTFRRQRPIPAKGLLAIGDSAAFIDPFTGSGMYRWLLRVLNSPQK